MDKKRKIIVFLNLTLLILTYFIFLSLLSFPLFFIIVSFYIMFRVFIDWILILYSFNNDLKVRTIISKITNNKIPITVRWNERLNGVNKWIIYNIILLTMGLIYYELI